MIFIDPSESRERTRLPDTILSQAKVINRLEEFTGADLLVSTLKLPLRDLTDDDVTTNLLRRHCENGYLIQRKSGRDYLNSIPDLSHILYRMCQWTPAPILLISGQFMPTREGTVCVDGQDTDWSYNAYLGGKWVWQNRGLQTERFNAVGKVVEVLRDSLIPSVINVLLDSLRDDNPLHRLTLHNPIPRQVIGEPDWSIYLTALKIGIGEDKMTILQRNMKSLADALCYLSDYDNLRAHKIEGIGKSHVRRAKERLGLADDECLERVWKDKETEVS